MQGDNLSASGRSVLRLVAAAALAVVLTAPAACARNSADTATLKEAKAAYERGEFDQAAAQLKAIVKDAPEDAEARRTLALTLAAKGDNAGAIEQYRSVVAADPRDHSSLYRMALLERLTGEAKDAVAHLEAAAAVEPGPSYYDELARTYMQVGRYADAAGAWGKALDDKDIVDENRVSLLRVQAEAFANAGEYDAAKEALNEALEMDPDNGEIEKRLETFE